MGTTYSRLNRKTIRRRNAGRWSKSFTSLWVSALVVAQVWTLNPNVRIDTYPTSPSCELQPLDTNSLADEVTAQVTERPVWINIVTIGSQRDNSP